MLQKYIERMNMTKYIHFIIQLHLITSISLPLFASIPRLHQRPPAQQAPMIANSNFTKNNTSTYILWGYLTCSTVATCLTLWKLNQIQHEILKIKRMLYAKHSPNTQTPTTPSPQSPHDSRFSVALNFNGHPKQGLSAETAPSMVSFLANLKPEINENQSPSSFKKSTRPLSTTTWSNNNPLDLSDEDFNDSTSQKSQMSKTDSYVSQDSSTNK